LVGLHNIDHTGVEIISYGCFYLSPVLIFPSDRAASILTLWIACSGKIIGAYMLVLTRKVGEGIIIGDNITVKIIEMKSGGIRIGIDAPRETKIYRQEVYDRIRQENIEAARWDMADLDILSDELASRKVKK
jgi:carbon storage regulator